VKGQTHILYRCKRGPVSGASRLTAKGHSHPMQAQRRIIEQREQADSKGAD
jgi:hypothetical protein